jgi:hypothetical protein
MIESAYCIARYHSQCKEEQCECDCHKSNLHSLISPACQQGRHLACVLYGCKCRCHKRLGRGIKINKIENKQVIEAIVIENG